jgi:transposase
MDHIGIDVHKRESQIYILAEDGEIIERRIRTEPARFAAVLGDRPRARMLIEASTDSEWVARCLEALGHEVIIADPNFAPMYATRSRKVKTDRRDARALAEACLLGAYRPAHRLSDPQRHVRGRLGVRDALVHTRTRYISVIRALLRQYGYHVPSGSAGSFSDRVRSLPLPGRLLSVVAPLLALMCHLNQQLAYSDATIEHLAVQDPRVPRLRSVPSIGPVTAAAFLAAIDDVGRFHHAHQLEAYLGLVPREYSSGETQRRGPITKAGHSRVRWLLIPSRALDPAPPAPRGRSPLDLGPAHRHAPGQVRRRRRTGPPPGRHSVCRPPGWDGVCAPTPGAPSGPRRRAARMRHTGD